MRKNIAALLVVALAFSGCGSMMFRNPQSVIVRSNVPGAAVMEGNMGQGKAPGSVTLDRSRDHVLTVSAEGYAPASVTVESHLSWWRILTSVVLNGGHGIFTLFISSGFGIVTDIGSGAWQVLDDEVDVHLERAAFTAQPAALELPPEPTKHEPELTGTDAALRRALGPAPFGPAPSETQPTAARKFCSTCGKDLAKPGAAFCGECGAHQ